MPDIAVFIYFVIFFFFFFFFFGGGEGEVGERAPQAPYQNLEFLMLTMFLGVYAPTPSGPVIRHDISFFRGFLKFGGGGGGGDWNQKS